VLPMYSANYQSPLGPLYLVFRGDKLITLSFSEEGAAQWVRRMLACPLPEERPLPHRYARDLTEYFRGQRPAFDWELELIGTDFQKKVWHALLEIPYGQTATYKDIGEKCRCPGYRAIGQAVGANPIAIIVPCHRVVGGAGLGGYSGGLQIKRFLLEVEGAFDPPHDHA
jgi:methylated-DNA-[protein]-cysteine S-methyltransferase